MAIRSHIEAGTYNDMTREDISAIFAKKGQEQQDNVDNLALHSKLLAQGIASAPESVTGEISSNITGVAEAAQGTSRGSADTQKAAHELAQMSWQLRRLVEQFKLSAGGSETSPPLLERTQSKAAHASS